MEHTQNYHLPQWVKSDRIMMDDFNAAMASIESGMSANAQAAAAARSAANSAQSTANSAQSTANSALSSKPYVVGTYTGTGANLTVNVGFRPSFVIISGLTSASRMDDVYRFGVYGCATTGGGMTGQSVEFTSSGFVVRAGTPYPHLADSGRSYEYIAFK